MEGNGIYWFMFLGHLVGDYLLQNNWMAQNKKLDISEGTLACVVHCTLYSLCVCLFLKLGGFDLPVSTFSLSFFSLIFFSHAIIDRTHIIDYWLDFFGTRTWYSNLPLDKTKYPEYNIIPFAKWTLKQKDVHAIAWDKCTTADQTVTTAFGAFVYIMADNTVHLVLMTLIIKYFVK